MYQQNKFGGLKMLVVMILCITMISSLTFGTLAYFSINALATGSINVGSNINFIICDTSGTQLSATCIHTTDSSPASTVFCVKKIAGVDAKLRVYVNVSCLDENDNVVNILENGAPVAKITMGSNTGCYWENDTAASSDQLLVGAHWRYLKDSATGDYHKVVNDEIINLTASVVHNTSYRIRVDITVEMLQYKNANW